MTSQSSKCDAAPLESEPEYVDNPEPSEGERGIFLERPLRPTGGALAKTVAGHNVCALRYILMDCIAAGRGRSHVDGKDAPVVEKECSTESNDLCVQI